jgi:hypothetical protein
MNRFSGRKEKRALKAEAGPVRTGKDMKDRKYDPN